ncbi:hypothetical protein BN1723_018813 [Verticillium longisporum]|uniref:Uncharacterized protein n=1 Tax=Verticillium longisporum TaxID=100787 RepID=A0A0G4MJC7_VERLO|nr:hypothetical protein BN1708_019449 [Verticillium longisporum]CRK41282.1 hypothetical protein BN1723_018813 [Verticillium longisporum]
MVASVWHPSSLCPRNCPSCCACRITCIRSRMSWARPNVHTLQKWPCSPFERSVTAACVTMLVVAVSRDTPSLRTGAFPTLKS